MSYQRLDKKIPQNIRKKSSFWFYTTKEQPSKLLKGQNHKCLFFKENYDYFLSFLKKKKNFFLMINCQWQWNNYFQLPWKRKTDQELFFSGNLIYFSQELQFLYKKKKNSKVFLLSFSSTDTSESLIYFYNLVPIKKKIFYKKT